MLARITTSSEAPGAIEPSSLFARRMNPYRPTQERARPTLTAKSL